MKRRNFLHATAMLPFVGDLVSSNKVLAKDSLSVNGPRDFQGAAARDFFYKPVDAWAADFIPLYDNGIFQLFYLLDWRDSKNHGEGTPWYRVSTTDFVNFTEHGEMLARGSVTEQDLYVFTGSAIKANGQYHIFYTGHNPHLRQKGKPEQGVMHAVSNDMMKWKKNPEQTFFAPGDKYEPNDWRDPFVFWNEELKEYNMLLAARFKTGIPRRRGLTALCASKDLVKWEVREPFYAPALYFTHECPDLFRMGDWWYLVFSEFTDLVRTRYVMSRSLGGPWITPQRDDFDGHAFYAAKTASDGNKRFIFGWNPTRSDEKDNGNWNWGGNLVVHEVQQQSNGELTVRAPQTVSDAFANKSNYSFANNIGNVKVENGSVMLSAAGTFAASLAGKLPDRCKITAAVQFEENTKECGLMLRCSDDMDKAYYIRLEPRQNKLVFDMWPRDRSEVFNMVELSRDISLTAGTPVTMEVFIEGHKGVAYVNNIIAMNFRAYDLPEGNWGVFAMEGNATFKDISVSTL
ncbi:MAG TPA: family 43 glycosylhydrolase [Parafilimonas sp.]|nr:family 43 glycosylhydrolase [Parafilimonas sp.]